MTGCISRQMKGSLPTETGEKSRSVDACKYIQFKEVYALHKNVHLQLNNILFSKNNIRGQ
jgi:hypothetical protein